MKYLVILSALILLSQPAFAEDSKSFNLKAGAHDGGFGVGLAFEYKVNGNWTVGSVAESVSITSGTISARSSGTGLNARYYFSEALAQGTYIGSAFM
ncbi:MAG: hypothetical protein QM484_09840 [Woeseiaceae bacterium]